jgi:hypothetical protein
MFLWTLEYPSCTSNGCSNFWRSFCPRHCMWHNLKLVYFVVCVYMLGEAIKLRFRQANTCKSSHSFVSLKSSGWSTGNGWGHSNSKLYLIWIVVGKYKVKFPCTIPMKTDVAVSLLWENWCWSQRPSFRWLPQGLQVGLYGVQGAVWVSMTRSCTCDYLCFKHGLGRVQGSAVGGD